MRIALKKFGDILLSRPAGREAGLALKAYLKPKSGEKIELDFDQVLSVGPSWLDEFLGILQKEYGKARVVCLPSKNQSVVESLKVIRSASAKE